MRIVGRPFILFHLQRDLNFTWSFEPCAISKIESLKSSCSGGVTCMEHCCCQELLILAGSRPSLITPLALHAFVCVRNSLEPKLVLERRLPAPCMMISFVVSCRIILLSLCLWPRLRVVCREPFDYSTMVWPRFRFWSDHHDCFSRLPCHGSVCQIRLFVEKHLLIPSFLFNFEFKHIICRIRYGLFWLI